MKKKTLTITNKITVF